MPSLRIDLFRLAVIRSLADPANGKSQARVVDGGRVDDSSSGQFAAATEIDPPHDATPDCAVWIIFSPIVAFTCKREGCAMATRMSPAVARSALVGHHALARTRRRATTSTDEPQNLTSGHSLTIESAV